MVTSPINGTHKVVRENRESDTISNLIRRDFIEKIVIKFIPER